jgi:multicomponent Na+:H+ antiporter subunit A
MFSNTLDSSAIASWMPGEAIPSLLVIAFLGAALSFLVLPRLGKSAGPSPHCCLQACLWRS